MVATIASAASSVGQKIYENPSMATSLLATNVPKASNFYISYFIVQGLTIASGVLSQVVGFVIFTLLYKYLTGTPRAMYTKWANLSAISWGSVLPVYTNIAVISTFRSTPQSHCGQTNSSIKASPTLELPLSCWDSPLLACLSSTWLTAIT